MLIHPQINPIALDLGFLQVHWYGLTYLAAFGMFYLLATRRATKPPFAPGWQRIEIEDMLFAGVLGVVLGGRLGYVLFYKPTYYFSHPSEIIAVWQGGMAFHGGLLGVITAGSGVSPKVSMLSSSSGNSCPSTRSNGSLVTGAGSVTT